MAIGTLVVEKTSEILLDQNSRQWRIDAIASKIHNTTIPSRITLSTNSQPACGPKRSISNSLTITDKKSAAAMKWPNLETGPGLVLPRKK